jgi:hypothetical protein
VYTAAPRLERRLLEAIVRLDDPSAPIAENYRRLREHAAQLDVPRPSYECFRQLVHDTRSERARRRANRQTLIRVALYLDGSDELNRLDLAPQVRL